MWALAFVGSCSPPRQGAPANDCFFRIYGRPDPVRRCRPVTKQWWVYRTYPLPRDEKKNFRSVALCEVAASGDLFLSAPSRRLGILIRRHVRPPHGYSASGEVHLLPEMLVQLDNATLDGRVTCAFGPPRV